jgi:hypothetical protein
VAEACSCDGGDGSLLVRVISPSQQLRPLGTSEQVWHAGGALEARSVAVASSSCDGGDGCLPAATPSRHGCQASLDARRLSTDCNWCKLNISLKHCYAMILGF